MECPVLQAFGKMAAKRLHNLFLADMNLNGTPHISNSFEKGLKALGASQKLDGKQWVKSNIHLYPNSTPLIIDVCLAQIHLQVSTSATKIANKNTCPP